jgi:hypothetical protein
MSEEILESQEQQEEAPKPKIVTAFGVLIDENGNMFVERSADVFSFPIERQVSFVEIRRHCSEIINDLNAQAAAEYTALKLLQKGE